MKKEKVNKITNKYEEWKKQCQNITKKCIVNKIDWKN